MQRTTPHKGVRSTRLSGVSSSLHCCGVANDARPQIPFDDDPPSSRAGSYHLPTPTTTMRSPLANFRLLFSPQCADELSLVLIVREKKQSITALPLGNSFCTVQTNHLSSGAAPLAEISLVSIAFASPQSSLKGCVRRKIARWALILLDLPLLYPE